MSTSSNRQRRDPWADALSHLRQIDPAWGSLIERIGPCSLRPRRDRFGTLVEAIIGQQISAKAAASINARLLTLAGGPHDPASLVALGEERLRSAGLSGVKARYVLHLAEGVQAGAVPLHRFGRWSDQEVVDCLTAVKGIGVWTAEMFLIFALNRPDVLPVSDLGIRVGIRDWFGLDELPTPSRCRDLTESWRPHRTVAIWYLWRRRDGGGPSEKS